MKDKIGWIVYFICIVSIVFCGIRGAWALGDDFNERNNLIAHAFAEWNETGGIITHINWNAEIPLPSKIEWTAPNGKTYIYKLQETNNESTGSNKSI